MIVKTQKEIKLVNTCGAILRTTDLEGAILWYTKLIYGGKPVSSNKKVFMWGRYPAVAIHQSKIHVHRLLYSYWNNWIYKADEYVHHKNENRLDNRRENLELMKASEHQSITNKGRKQTKEWIEKRITKTANAKRGKKYPKIYENPSLLSPEA